MLSAAGWGFVTTTSLLLGAGLAAIFKPSRPVIGAIMAFGAGALISAVSFELVGEALDAERGALVALGLSAGALAFFVGDGVIEKKGGRRTQALGWSAGLRIGAGHLSRYSPGWSA
jgi:ZIP family zinc transporter